MFWKLRQTLNRTWFNHWCRDVLKTPPIEPSKDGVVILSMISHLDLMMYLAAIKTFYRYFKRGEIVILNDGTLTENDRRLLQYHVNPSRVVHINEVKTNSCPKGACWERLLLISDYVDDNYVIQLDADSLILKDMPEVSKNLEENRSFALGSGFRVNGKPLGLNIHPMKEFCLTMQSLNSEYVEIVAEKSFCRLSDYQNLKYAKSSACFAGFAKGGFSRPAIEAFSGRMEQLIGKRWFEWGTEKVTSNYIISNAPSAGILPYPKYVSYYAEPAIDYNQSAYLHFTGTHRFKNGFYINMARKVIRALMSERKD